MNPKSTPLRLILALLGLQQAENVGLRLKGKGITKILASPLVRAIQTAHAVAIELGLGKK